MLPNRIYVWYQDNSGCYHTEVLKPAQKTDTGNQQQAAGINPKPQPKNNVWQKVRKLLKNFVQHIV